MMGAQGTLGAGPWEAGPPPPPLQSAATPWASSRPPHRAGPLSLSCRVGETESQAEQGGRCQLTAAESRVAPSEPRPQASGQAGVREEETRAPEVAGTVGRVLGRTWIRRFLGTLQRRGKNREPALTAPEPGLHTRSFGL